jgi:hypothetical protein
LQWLGLEQPQYAAIALTPQRFVGIAALQNVQIQAQQFLQFFRRHRRASIG